MKPDEIIDLIADGIKPLPRIVAWAIVRMVLDAIRVPTKTMLHAGENSGFINFDISGLQDHNLSIAYTAMIDALKDELTETEDLRP